jgi:hypothetical protein
MGISIEIEVLDLGDEGVDVGEIEACAANAG